jgi:hypothetical protein
MSNIAMKKRSLSLAVPLFLLLSGVGQGGTLFIPQTMVLATDVLSGPSFIVSGNFGPNDVVNVSGAGLVDLAFGSGDFIANAAGVIVAPQTTDDGLHPGEIGFDPAALEPNLPLAAVLIGNDSLGFFPLFPANASAGLGSPTPPSDVSALDRTLGDIFGPGFGGISSGTTLQLRVNDSYFLDNIGFFLINTVTVPEPSSLALAGTGLTAVLCVLLHRRLAQSRITREISRPRLGIGPKKKGELTPTSDIT